MVKPTGASFSVTMISAVTPKGALRFAVFQGTPTARSFIEFCKRLPHDVPGPIYLIVDGRPSQRARAGTQYVANTVSAPRRFTYKTTSRLAPEASPQAVPADQAHPPGESLVPQENPGAAPTLSR